MNNMEQLPPCAGLNKNLTRLRKYHHLNQMQMAKMLFISRSAYASWENGRNRPPLETIMAMKDLFKIPDVVDMIQNCNWVPPN